VSDKPVLFLGQWCLLNEKNKKWKDLDYKVMPYHWSNTHLMKDDYKYINNLYEDLLDETIKNLNDFHHINWSKRSWRILIGPWLFFATCTLFDRWQSISNALNKHSITDGTFSNKNMEKLTPFDHDEFGELSKTDEWNYILYSSIFYHINNTPIKKIKSNQIIALEQKNELKNNILISKRLLGFIKKIVKSSFVIKINSLLIKDNKHFIYLPYIKSKLEEFKLYFLLGDFPLINNHNNKIKDQISTNVNSRSRINYSTKNKTDFEKYIRKTLPIITPVIYIEGFKKLLDNVNKNNFPKKVKKIYTSVGIWKDEIFKAWVAQKIADGTKLIIGQHGGDYGSAYFNIFENHEIKVSDAYLSWGWKDNDKIIKAPATVMIKKSESRWDKNGKIVIVPAELGRYFTQLNMSHRFADRADQYYNRIVELIISLPKEIQNKIIVKLSPSDDERGNPMLSRLSNKFPEIEVQNTSNLEEVINNCRLSIHPHDGTTFLETMGNDQPSLLIDNEFIFPRRENAKPYYNKLFDVGISHSTIESASEMIIKIFTEVDSWWNKEKVVSAKKYFCNRFVYNPKDPIKKLSKIISDI